MKKKNLISQQIKNKAIDDYINGMSYREVGSKYKVNHKTVRYWVLKSGNNSRNKEESNDLMSKKKNKRTKTKY